MGLSDAEFWGLTLHELDVLALRWRQQQQRRDRPVAMLIQVMLNVNRDTKTRPYPFELDEILQALGHTVEPVEPPPPPSVEELHQKMATLSQLFPARNGQG